MNSQKYSSSIKVGILTVVALTILVMTVLWVKGRSLSTGERIEVVFRDINGIRAGSGVQMMGLRIGQIEEITPVIQGLDSHVKVKFVITEKGVKIPKLSTISIQQSGLIGEQFIEITPPKIKKLFLETTKNTTSLKKGDRIYMEFQGELKEIGEVITPQVLSTKELPHSIQDRISTPNTLSVDYIITLPGLFFRQDSLSAKFIKDKFVFFTTDGEEIAYPKENGSPYTIVEPIRISEFMELQFEAARSLGNASDRISELVSDDLIYELQSSAKNINELVKQAGTTLAKAETLIDSSRKDLEEVFKQTNKLASSLTVLSDNVNELITDQDFKATILTTAKSVGKLSDNLNSIFEDKQTKEIINNIEEISRNLSEITFYVNEFTKDEKLKTDLKKSVCNINKVMEGVNTTLKDLNELPDGEKLKLKDALADVVVMTRNLREFSQKLNKRFLLFRLMF